MTNEEVATISKFFELLIKIDKREEIVVKHDYEDKNNVKTKENSKEC